jgi:phage/plasmid-associated DNA primase
MSGTKVPSETNRNALVGMSNDQLKTSLRRCQCELESYTEAKIIMDTLIREKDKLLRKKNKGTGRQRRSRGVSDPEEDDMVRYSDYRLATKMLRSKRPIAVYSNNNIHLQLDHQDVEHPYHPLYVNNQFLLTLHYNKEEYDVLHER